MQQRRHYRKDDFGFSAHEFYDLLAIMGASPRAIMGDAPISGGDHQYAESNSASITSAKGVKVQLGRKVRRDKDQAKGSLFSIEYVEANTQEDVDEFIAALEGLESERARGIIDSWENEGWPTTLLRTLSNRLIMVVDSTLDTDAGMGPGRNFIRHVDLKSAFEGGSGIVKTEVMYHVTERLPEQECVERIAASVGAFQFTSMETTRIARDVWNAFQDNENIMDCLAWGLLGTGRIRQISQWSSWHDVYPFLRDTVC